MENTNFINSCLTKLVQHSEGPRSQEEMFDGSHWENFKKGMEADFELFELTEDKEKLRWLVSRMTNPVKLFWAKMADKAS